MNSKNGVSVVISTFNGAHKLEETLKHLAGQKAIIPWEIILIDNASTDSTKEVAEYIWDKIGKKEIPFYTYSQPIPGKSYAQELGYSKANYEFLLIVDDDNWLCDTYVQTSFEIMEMHPEIGGLGGWCEAEFESEKPEWFELFAHNFAVGKQGAESGDITHKKGCLYGAGMVIRKSHWLELKRNGFTPVLTCRKGNTLSSGGDTEYSYALRLLGYKLWYDERLYFKHFMPAERLNLAYVKKLRKAMSESDHLLRAYRDELDGIPLNKKAFCLENRIEVKKYLFPSIKWLLKGNLLHKENAKSNIRNFRRNMNSYPEYYRLRRAIKKWTTSDIKSIA